MLLPGGPWSLAFFTGRQKEKTQITHNVRNKDTQHISNSCHLVIGTILLCELLTLFASLLFLDKTIFQYEPSKISFSF